MSVITRSRDRALLPLLAGHDHRVDGFVLVDLEREGGLDQVVGNVRDARDGWGVVFALATLQ